MNGANAGMERRLPASSPSNIPWQRFFSGNFPKRVLSALVLGPLVLGVVYVGGLAYIALIVLITVLAAREWLAMAGKSWVWRLVAIPYLGGFMLAMLGLRLLSAGNAKNEGSPVFYLLAVVWGTDVGAYVAGKLIGGPKLAPRISPGKTWAGLVGGMALAALLGYAVLAVLGSPDMIGGLNMALILSVISQAGDLFESWFKRRAGVKNSGNLIPGHGGILDRIDGLIFAAIAFMVSFIISIASIITIASGKGQ
jgi:phosphatidate cytidylyltransferase